MKTPSATETERGWGWRDGGRERIDADEYCGILSSCFPVPDKLNTRSREKQERKRERERDRARETGRERKTERERESERYTSLFLGFKLKVAWYTGNDSRLHMASTYQRRRFDNHLIGFSID